MLEHKARIVSCIQRFVEEQLLPAVSFPNMVLDIAMAYPKHEGDDFKSLLVLGSSRGLKTLPRFLVAPRSSSEHASQSMLIGSFLISYDIPPKKLVRHSRVTLGVEIYLEILALQAH